MNKLRFRIQLLALISIFFIYKAIDSFFSNNMNEGIVWILITFIYLISLVILYFVIRRWAKEDKIQKNLH